MKHEFSNKVKKELETSKGYDFKSEFWDDEMLTVFAEIIDAVQIVISKDFSDLAKALKLLELPRKNCFVSCDEGRISKGECECRDRYRAIPKTHTGKWINP